MITTDVLTDALQRNLQMLKSTIEDFTDADMLVRPAPAANHAAWQLGHTIAAEARIITATTPGSAPDLPEGFAEKFKKDTAKLNEAAAFPTKAELLAQFEMTRANTVQWAQQLTAEQLSLPVPEPMRARVPTMAHLPLLILMHTTMHVGQFQVIRRSLGKPVLF